MIKRIFFIFQLLIGMQLVSSQELEIQGNGAIIPGNGSNTPNLSDNTLYSSTPVSAIQIHSFTLTNRGDTDMRVESIRSNSRAYQVTGRIRRIGAGESATFDISFEPNWIGEYAAFITIRIKVGRDRTVFGFHILGSAEQASNEPEIMISQYYENGNSDLIEIKNMTAFSVKKNKYFLAKYDASDDLNKAPKARNTIQIDQIDPLATEVYNGLNLRGNEVLVISTSRGRNCYRDRVEVIGEQNNYWGDSRSFSKGGCSSESAHETFNVNDWTQLSISEVDDALATQNIDLGTYQIGLISWFNDGWTDNALPDRTRIVHIDAGYNGGLGNITACDLIVNAPLDFDNDKTNSVVVYRDLEINESFTLGDRASLVMYDDMAKISGEIQKIERSSFRNNTHDFTYWSSPVEAARLSEVFNGVDLNRIYYYDQSQTDTSDKNHPEYWNTWVLASGSMDIAEGYAAEGVKGTTGVHEVLFRGKPNNGVIYVDLNFHDDGGANSNLDNDFNMLGNPYPSAIDIEAFFELNEEQVEPVVYLWTHATAVDGESGDYSFDDYATYNYVGGTGVGKISNGEDPPTKNIGSSQGFFVRAKKKDAVLFNNSIRMVDANNQFFKAQTKSKGIDVNEKDRVWLDLTTNKGGFNQILIGFDTAASDAYDSGYDALKFKSNNKIGFYSELNSQKMTIQGFGSFDRTKEVQLGFDTDLGQREYKISIAKMEGLLKNATILLYDHVLQQSHDLKNAPYVFNHSVKGEFKSRFSLKFTSSTLSLPQIEIEEKPLIVYNEDEVFKVVAEEEVSELRLFDMQGRQILQLRPREKRFEFIAPHSKKGEVLLLQISMKDQGDIMKKIYKQ